MPINTPNLSRLFQTAGQQKQNTGTGYTNLNRLFQANTGNQLGQKVAGNVQQQIGNVQSQLGQQQQEFQTESQKGQLGGEADIAKRKEVIGRFSAAPTDTVKQNTGDVIGGNMSSGLSNALQSNPPANQEPSAEDISAFGRFTGGQYAGPQGLKDTGALQSTAAQLRGQVSNFSPSGTQELLRRSVGGDRYTQGQQRLDSLLMNRSALTPIQRQAGALGQQINRADLAASGQAELAKSQAQKFGAETQEQLNTGMTGIDTSVQGQLASAQAAEKDRLQKLSAIQQFAANKSPKLDITGNPILDQYGNPTYDTSVQARGGTDVQGQLDYLQTLLKGQNAQAGEMEQLFGTGNFDQGRTAYDNAVAAAQFSSHLGESYSSIDKERALEKAKQDYLSTRGIAGKSELEGSQESLYKNIASTLANSQNAQGLTQEGVASAQQRAQYEALNKLLGKTSSESKYRIDDPTKYTAGKFLLNPDQLKRSLGYE